MGKPVDDVLKHLQPNAKGIAHQEDIQSRFVAPSQSLGSDKMIPYKYLRHYNWLLANNPIKAQAYFDLCAVDFVSQSKPVDTKALDALNRVGQPNTLKRRI